MSPVRKSTFFFLVFVTGLFCQIPEEPQERKYLKTIFDLLIGISNGFYFEPNGTVKGKKGRPANNKVTLDCPSHGKRKFFCNGINSSGRLDCPLCDSSVYSYCSEKLLHDACCCLNSYEHKLPQQCKYADCGFLHANTCREHKLITACCCSKFL